MLNKKFRKILSGFIVAAYMLIYTVPAGMCISPTPQASLSVAKPALRTATQPTALKLQGDISITKGNPKISLSLRDSDVRQVLRMFADKAGLNIMFHDSATGKVTLDLVNVPLNDAFRMVMQITNLTYYIDQNTMVVVSAGASQVLNLSEQEMATIPVKYVDAAVLADFLNRNIFSTNKPGLSNALVAVTNPATNEILIFGTQNDYLMAKKIVNQFDVRPKEQTFTVNHTTPKEMSTLICNLLFREISSSTSSKGSWTVPASSGQTASASAGSADASAGGSASPSANGGSGSGSAGSGGTAGGASSSSTSGSTSTSTAGGTTSVAGLTLGGGITACKYQSRVTAGSLSSLNSTGMSITYFPQRGTIQVIGGSQQQMEMVSDFITKNDKKQPQAYLELSIIELNESGSKDFNNSWQVWSTFFSGSFGNDGKFASNPIYPTVLFQGDSKAPDVPGAFGRYAGPMMVNYTMNYLIKNGKGRVLSNPKIMITNGEESTIDLSSDYVKMVTSQVLAGAGGIAGAVQKTYTIGSDEGIKISLLPFISPQGYVTLNIKPNYSTEKEKVTAPGAVAGELDLVATLLQRRNLDLKNVRIKDGETLVIGGMIREIEEKTITKMPVLGDIPGIGAFFRNTNNTKKKEELVIMITPKIIKDSEDVVTTQDTTL